MAKKGVNMTKGSNQLKISFMPGRCAIKSYKGRFMQFPDISKKKNPQVEGWVFESAPMPNAWL